MELLLKAFSAVFFALSIVPLTNIFVSKSRKLTQQNSHRLVKHILCGSLVQWHIIIHETYRPRIVSVVLQLKDLVNENIKTLGKGELGQPPFYPKNEHVTYCLLLACWS